MAPGAAADVAVLGCAVSLLLSRAVPSGAAPPPSLAEAVVLLGPSEASAEVSRGASPRTGTSAGMFLKTSTEKRAPGGGTTVSLAFSPIATGADGCVRSSQPRHGTDSVATEPTRVRMSTHGARHTMTFQPAATFVARKSARRTVSASSAYVPQLSAPWCTALLTISLRVDSRMDDLTRVGLTAATRARETISAAGPLLLALGVAIDYRRVHQFVKRGRSSKFDLRSKCNRVFRLSRVGECVTRVPDTVVCDLSGLPKHLARGPRLGSPLFHSFLHSHGGPHPVKATMAHCGRHGYDRAKSCKVRVAYSAGTAEGRNN